MGKLNRFFCRVFGKKYAKLDFRGGFGAKGGKFSNQDEVLRLESGVYDHMGGIPGFFLTNREFNPQLKQNAEIVNFFGPTGFTEVMQEAKYFIGPMNQMKIYEYGDPKTHQNHGFIKVKSGLRNINFTEGLKDEDIKIDVIQNINKYNQEILSFIGVPNQKRGKFLPQKALEFGCIPNKHFQQL